VKTSTTLFGLLLVAAVGAGAYWLGTKRASSAHGPEAVGTAASGVAASPATPARRILYYRNPMGLPDTSPTPKKDSMGMDYIPVYEGEDTPGADAAAGEVRVSTQKVQKLGVRTEAAAMRTLGRTVRASGRVEPDERRIAMISPKFEGYVERLHVNATGQPVAKGQALFEAYSPELVSTQSEYAIAAQGVQAMKDAGGEAQAGMKQLAEASLARLRNWDLPAEEIAALEGSGEVRRTVTLRSPVSGIVTEKKAFQGMRFMPGEALYQVTDLSSVWVIADVFEQDIGLVRTGSRAGMRFAAYPERIFEGRITYIYPTLKAETRSVPVRIELPNPGHLLKPAMSAQIELQVGGQAQALTVPDSAVIDSGTRRIVLVQRDEGRFEPREVKLGARGAEHVEILQGVRAGEQVVVAANFLIDAESNLKAAIAGLGAAGAGASAPAAGKAAAGTPPSVSATKAPAVGHVARGRVDSVDAAAGSVTLEHEPVPSLKWPAMTMDFKLANPALLQGLKPGTRLNFEFVERQPGEWVVTRIVPEAAVLPAKPPAAKPAGASGGAGGSGHSGH
jgi:Cu(I)/Ag(I) efflux system membrane fusion protein